MRRFTMAVAVVMMSLLAAVAGTAVASAAPVGGPPQVNTFVGTTVFQFATSGCGFVHQTFDATYDGGRHPGSFHLDGCVTTTFLPFAPAAAAPNDATIFGYYQGTFTITAPDGRRIAGTVSGTLTDAGFTDCVAGEVGLAFVMTPTTGTRLVGGVRRPFVLDGLWCDDATPGQVDAINGTFALAP